MLKRTLQTIGRQPQRTQWVSIILVEQQQRSYARQSREIFDASYAPPNAQNPHTTFPVAAVFGCTGFLGKFVTQELALNGYQVITPYRDSDFKVQYHKVMGDVGQIVQMRFAGNRYDTMLDICARANVVVNCVGRNFWRKFDDSLETSNVTIPHLIAKAAAETGVNRFVHISCLNASADHPSELYRLKYKAEQLIKEEFPTATILRSAEMYGQNDKFLTNYAKRLQRTTLFGVPVVNQGQALRQPVYVGNVSDAVSAVLRQGHDSEGKTYDLAGPKQYKINEMIHFIAKHIQQRYVVTNIPKPLAPLVGYINELRSNRLTFSRDAAIRYQYDNVLDEHSGNLTFKDLGLAPGAMEDTLPPILRLFERFTGHTYRPTDYYLNESKLAAQNESALNKRISTLNNI